MLTIIADVVYMGITINGMRHNYDPYLAKVAGLSIYSILLTILEVVLKVSV